MTVDTHFGGFTPLHDPEGDEGPVFDCVVISGLGSHAFGSWKDRDSDHMWLRDALPEESPGAHVMIYGYDSKLAKSTIFQNLGDVASRFPGFSSNRVRKEDKLPPSNLHRTLFRWAHFEASNGTDGIGRRRRPRKPQSNVRHILFRCSQPRDGYQILTCNGPWSAQSSFSSSVG